MASNVVGNLIVNLAANIADFRSDMKKAAATSQREMRKIEKETREMKRNIQSSLSAVGGAFAALGVGLAVRGIVRATAEYERLGAALVTVEGSQKKANEQFKTLQDFAATTPFQLQEVVDGYIKLKARGLDPSIRSMTAFGNVAGATGKSLDQFIEAVGDAATGEMERLKDFGIVARQQGDEVKFTFQGLTTTVGRNAREITDYLRSLGEVQFAGGNERQADTLGGAISNLQDAVFSVVSGGNVEGLKTSIRDLSSTLSDPQTKEGIQNLITGLITLASWLTKAAAKFAGFGESIGEFFAKAAAGIGGQEFGSAKEVRIELEHVEKQAEAIIAVLQRGVPEGRSQLESKLQGLLADAKTLRGLYAAMTAAPPTPPKNENEEETLIEPEVIDNSKIKYASLADTLGLVEHRQKALNELNKEAAALTTSVMTAQETYNKQMSEYQAFLSQNLITQETFNRLQAEAKARLEDSAEGFDIMKAAGEEAGRATQAAFADFFYNLGSGIDDMAKSFIDAMRRMLSEALALQALRGLFGGTSFGDFLGIKTAPANNALGGISSGGPTWVGEHGPELVNLPKGSVVTPNSKVGGNSLTVNVHAEGAMSPVEVARMVQEGVAEAVRMTNYINRRGHLPA